MHALTPSPGMEKSKGSQAHDVEGTYSASLSLEMEELSIIYTTKGEMSSICEEFRAV